MPQAIIVGTVLAPGTEWHARTVSQETVASIMVGVKERRERREKRWKEKREKKLEKGGKEKGVKKQSAKMMNIRADRERKKWSIGSKQISGDSGKVWVQLNRKN